MPGCKKKKYANRKEAKAALKNYNKRFVIQAKSVYVCPYCGWWHFTTMNTAEAKSDRKWHVQQAKQMGVTRRNKK